MLDLLVPILVSVVCCFFFQISSSYDDVECKYIKKDWFFFGIMAIELIIFAGLRTGYNDTGTYVQIYEHIPKDVNPFEFINLDYILELGSHPGFMFVNRLIRSWGFSSQSYLMFYSVITNGIYLWFIRKYSNQIPLAVFFFFTLGTYIFTLAAIKQSIAMAICLIATHYAIQKRYVPFVLFVFLAATFHPYSLMYLIVPFLTFNTWSNKTYIMLILFGMAGVGLEAALGSIVSITDMLGDGYDSASFSGEGVNPFRFAVHFVPVILSYLVKDKISEKNNRTFNIITNLSILNAEIMFVALFGTANYFARLANYFLPFQMLAIPWLLSLFDPKSKRFITISAVSAYCFYFYYTHAIHESFDHHFWTTTLNEYVQTLFNGDVQ